MSQRITENTTPPRAPRASDASEHATNTPPRAPGTPPHARTTNSRGARAGVIALATAILGAVLALLLAPHASLSEHRSGDQQLIADVEEIVGGKPRALQSLAVAKLGDGDPRFAALGDVGGGNTPTPDTVFELGSVTKVFTGMLLADAVSRGEMSLDAPISDHLAELAGTPVGDRTARQLATHTSGIPSLLKPQSFALRAMLLGDAYEQWDTERFLTEIATVTPKEPGESSYSNAGLALLGHAAARAAGAQSYEALLNDRLLSPLGMANTQLVRADQAAPDGFATPHHVNGFNSAAWAGEGYAPAGTSTRTTLKDMTRFTQAVLDGSAPGMAALDPALPGSDDLHGLGWANDTLGGKPLTWHNGATEGSRAMLAVDRESGTAAVVLGNSAQWVDKIGANLVGATMIYQPAGWKASLVNVVLGLFFIAAAWFTALRAKSGLELAVGAGNGLIGLLISWFSGPWHLLPTVAWGLVPGLAIGATVFAIVRMRELPWWPEKGRAALMINLALTLGLPVLIGISHLN